MRECKTLQRARRAARQCGMKWQKKLSLQEQVASRNSQPLNAGQGSYNGVTVETDVEGEEHSETFTTEKLPRKRKHH